MRLNFLGRRTGMSEGLKVCFRTFLQDFSSADRASAAHQIYTGGSFMSDTISKYRDISPPLP